MQIPWGSLTTGKASVVVHSVRLCVQPRAVDGPPRPDMLRAMEAAVQLKKQELVQRTEEELYKIPGALIVASALSIDSVRARSKI